MKPTVPALLPRAQFSRNFGRCRTYVLLGLTLGCASALEAAPVVSRLNPPSGLFLEGDPHPPITSRFVPDQRFDLQATISPDAGQTITGASFSVDGEPLPMPAIIVPLTSEKVPVGTVSASLRAFSRTKPGIVKFSVTAQQSDGQSVTAEGNFEIVPLTESGLPKAKNVIFMIGDGMGSSHRTAARLVQNSMRHGKARAPLAMDTLPVTGLVSTASLNSIITDSSPGAASYTTGNKSNNNQHGAFPDDSADHFDNPRVEIISEYLARKHGKAIGIVTNAEVHDSTPGSVASHTASRHAGTGICDQFLDEAALHGGLKVLMGGGLRWFLPKNVPGNGSTRDLKSDYALEPGVAEAWRVPQGAPDPNRDLVADFKAAGFAYAANSTELKALPPETEKVLGLFHLLNMNATLDRVNGRRGNDTVVQEGGFPDQPLLEEMTETALKVLSKDPDGFYLMVEGASIDKMAHAMDADRWIVETIEFDKAVAVAKRFVEQNPDTLLVVTADHECGGVGIIGVSRVTTAELKERAVGNATQEQARKRLLDEVLQGAGSSFPAYKRHADGYPESMDPDHKLLINYAAGADRYEDWLASERPVVPPPASKAPPEVLARYPVMMPDEDTPDAPVRDKGGNFLVPGMFTGPSAAHTGSDIPCSALGRGSMQFTGTMDNTDLFFKVLQATVAGAE